MYLKTMTKEFGEQTFMTHEEWLNAPFLTRGDCPEGTLHSTTAPAVIRTFCQAWYINGQLHRDDGPAVEYVNGKKEWWKKGQLHREDGPAVVMPSGNELYFLNNQNVSFDKFQEMIKKTK